MKRRLEKKGVQMSRPAVSRPSLTDVEFAQAVRMLAVRLLPLGLGLLIYGAIFNHRVILFTLFDYPIFLAAAIATLIPIRWLKHRMRSRDK
jgi:hypothetical protein